MHLPRLMSLLSWATIAALGRIVIFVWQKFPAQYVPTKFIKDVHACDLCSGTYIYPVLFFFWAGLGVGDSLLSGIITSFVVWVFVKGMKTLYEPTLIIK